MRFVISKFFKLLAEGNVNAAKLYMALHVPDTLTKFYSLTDDEDLNEKR